MLATVLGAMEDTKAWTVAVLKLLRVWEFKNLRERLGMDKISKFQIRVYVDDCF